MSCIERVRFSWGVSVCMLTSNYCPINPPIGTPGGGPSHEPAGSSKTHFK